MAEDTTKQPLIINNPYEEPTQHYSYDSESKSLKLVCGRRDAGYMVLKTDSENEVGELIPLELANQIRKKVAAWRDSGYPGTTKVTKDLLFHWTRQEGESSNRLFFCQIEAAETLIYLNEARSSDLQGMEIPPSGGEFQRLCAKMATGTGKTVVMAMMIAWQVLNKASYPTDPRFSKYILLIAPGLTIRKRLEVLRLPPLKVTDSKKSYYEEFSIIPISLKHLVSRGVVEIINRHRLEWESHEQRKKKKGVLKIPAVSNAGYSLQVFGQQHRTKKNWIVINDEAHHAWHAPGIKAEGATKAEIKDSTQWVRALNRIHAANGILHCFDFTATPFAPTNKKNLQTELFPWVVSDFSLSDAIESGLVKTPRAIIDNPEIPSAQGSHDFRRLYADCRKDLNRKTQPDEPLPQKVLNAYHLLGADYQQVFDSWMSKYDEEDIKVPPVQITVANRTETAARVAHTFRDGEIPVDPLSEEERILHIDSTVLNKAEAADDIASSSDSGRGRNAAERQENLRNRVDTVGKSGQPGEQLTNIVSVMMLSEGWDANNVTQIMGLRAFTSQLLCEQVIGRGLRRRSYDVDAETGLLIPEFVTVFGVPFSLLLTEGSETKVTPPVATKEIKVLTERNDMAISWPNVLRIDEELETVLELDRNAIDTLLVNYDPVTFLETGLLIDGEVDSSALGTIDLREAIAKYRLQTSIFKIVKDLYTEHKPSWKGYPSFHFARLVVFTEWFVRSRRLRYNADWEQHIPVESDPIARKLAIALTLKTIVAHLWKFIRDTNVTSYQLVLDQSRPMISTGDMSTWFTSKPVYDTKYSHINRCVSDSGWETQVAQLLDSEYNEKYVVAWVKNTHRIGFKVSYQFENESHIYLPDFIIKLTNGVYLVLEVKGVETEQDTIKFKALQKWCKAVSAQGIYGKWVAEMAMNVQSTNSFIRKHVAE